jgi:arsenate reductase
MTRILILCTGNSARSQISEGLFRNLGGDGVEAHSAGTHPAGMVHPLAVESMRERGIDITSQYSKSMDVYKGQSFDYVITVCDEAHQECPFFPGARHQLHWSTPDPSFVAGSEKDRLDAFRNTVASLEQRIRDFLEDVKRTNPT